MDSKIFRYTGVGSKAWYISRIKLGQNGRTGFTYLRGDSVSDGKALSFDEIKSAMSQLVAAGYVKRHSKPDAPRSDKYEVTSFGHRYLEEHKDELEIKPEPKTTGAVPTNVEHHVPSIPPFKPSLPKPSIDDEPMTPVFQDTPVRPITPNPNTNKEQGSDEPRINKNDEIQGEYCIQCNKASDGGCIIGNHLRTTDPAEYFRSQAELKKEQLKTSPDPVPVPAGMMIVPKATPGTFIEQLKEIAGDLALEKFANQITVKELIDHAEKWS